MEVTVSPEHNCEVRRITLTNHDSQAHDLELTSYVEPVLAAHGADLAHPAFGKLFLETEYQPAAQALAVPAPAALRGRKTNLGRAYPGTGRRRAGRRPVRDRPGPLSRQGPYTCQSRAMAKRVSLSNQTGAVLDPIFSLRQRVRVSAGMSVSVAFTTAVANSQEAA